MARVALVGAVAVKVRPDTEDFKRDMKRQIDRELRGYEAEAPVAAELDQSSLADVKRDLDRWARGQGKNIDFGVRANTRDARDQIDSVKVSLEELRKLAGKSKLSPTFDNKGTAEHLLELRRIRDEIGLVSREMGNLNGKPWLEAQRTLEGLNAEADKLRKQIAGINALDGIDLDVDVRDYTALRRELRGVAEERERIARITDTANRAAADQLRIVENIREEMGKIYGPLTAEDTEHLKLEREKLDLIEQQGESAARMEMERLEANRNLLRNAKEYEIVVDRINAARRNEITFQSALEDVYQNVKPQKVTFMANLINRHETEAMISALARDRKIDLDVQLRREGLAMVQGFLSTASGWGMYSRAVDDTVESLKNVDEGAMNITKLGLGIGALTGGATAALGTVASLGEGIMRMTKSLAILPAVGVAGASAMYVVSKAFENFGAAISGDEEALLTLPRYAQEAAVAIYDMLDAMGSPVPDAFWNQMGPDLARAVREAEDDLAVGMTRIASRLGAMGQETARTAWAFAYNGTIERVLGNVEEMFARMENSGAQALSGLAMMLDDTSNQLPSFGDGIDDLTARWSAFSQKAQENGNWEAWIVEGRRELGGLMETLGETVSLVAEVGQVARSAGAPSWVDLGNAMEIVNRAAHGQFFQTNFKTLMEGAINGTKEAASGFAELGTDFLESSEFIKDALESIGRTTGDLFEGIGDILTNDIFQSGMLEFFSDLESAASILKPMWSDVGQIMGEAGMIGGEVMKVLASVATTFADHLAGVTHLTEAIADTIPVLGDMTTMLMDLINIPVRILSMGLAGVLDAFNALPGPIQTAALGVAGFALAAGKISRIAAVAGSGIAAFGRATDGSASALARSNPLMTRAGVAWATTGRAMDDASRKALIASGNLTRGERAMINTSYGLRDAATHFRNAGSSFKTAGAGLVTSIASSGAAVGTFRDRMSRAGEATRTFGSAVGSAAKGGFSPLRGAISGVSSALGGPLMIGLAATGVAIADLVGDVNDSQSAFNAMGENIKTFGSDSQEAAEAIRTAFENDIIPADSFGQQLENWVSKIEPFRNNLTEAMDEIGISAQEMTGAVTGSSDQYAEAMAKLSGSHDKLWNNNSAAIKSLQEMRLEFVENAVASKSSASAMGLTETGAAQLRSAMDTLQSGTGTATEKLGAMRLGLDALHGGQLSSMEANMQLVDTQTKMTDALRDTTNAAIESGGVVLDQYGNMDAAASTMFKTVEGGGIVLNEANAHARDFAASMTEWGDAALISGKQAYDAAIQQGKSVSEATRIAGDAVESTKSQMVTALDSMGYTFEQATAMAEQFTGQDWEVELTFMGRVDDFLEAKGIVEANGNEIDGKNFTAFLKANPEQSLEQIKNLAAAGMTWEESEFTSSFGAETAEADEKLAATIRRGEEFNNKDWVATLKGDETPFLDTVLAGTAAGEDFNGKEFEARFGANATKLQVEADSAMRRGEEIGSAEWVARIDANNEGFAEAFLTAKAQAEGFDGTEVEAYVLARIDDYQADMDLATQLRANIDGTAAEVSVGAQTDTYFLKMRAVELAAEGFSQVQIEKKLNLNTEEFNVLMGEASRVLESYESYNPTTKVNAETTEATGKIDDVKERAHYLDTTPSSVKVTAEGDAKEKLDEVDQTAQKVDQSEASPDVTLGGNPAAVREDLDHIQRKLDDIGNKNPTANLNVNTGTVIADLDTAVAKMDTFDSKEVWADLRANAAGLDADLAGTDGKLATFDARTVWADLRANAAGLDGDLAGASGKLGSFDSRTVWADLRANAAGLDGDLAGAAGKLGSFDSRTVWADLRANASGLDGDIAGARGKMQSFDAMVAWADLNARNNTASGIASARGALMAWANARYQASLTARNDTGSVVAAARSAMERVSDATYRATLTARDETGSVRNSVRSGLEAVARGHYEAVMRVNPGPAQSGAAAAQAAINSVQGKTVYIDVVTRKHNANGGLDTGNNSWAFANGGVMNAMNTRRYANGGENHTAMISQAQPTYRVWAEPETGGEAYIPLAMSKRTRSTAILDRVAKMFGYTLAQKNDVGRYADGGGQVGPGGHTFNITNHYPQAEPTSRTVNRSQAYIGAFAGV